MKLGPWGPLLLISFFFNKTSILNVDCAFLGLTIGATHLAFALNKTSTHEIKVSLNTASYVYQFNMAQHSMQYIYPMPIPGTQNSPLFKGKYITDFLDTLEALTFSS